MGQAASVICIRCTNNSDITFDSDSDAESVSSLLGWCVNPLRLRSEIGEVVDKRDPVRSYKQMGISCIDAATEGGWTASVFIHGLGGRERVDMSPHS